MRHIDANLAGIKDVEGDYMFEIKNHLYILSRTISQYGQCIKQYKGVED